MKQCCPRQQNYRMCHKSSLIPSATGRDQGGNETSPPLCRCIQKRVSGKKLKTGQKSERNNITVWSLKGLMTESLCMSFSISPTFMQSCQVLNPEICFGTFETQDKGKLRNRPGKDHCYSLCLQQDCGLNTAIFNV